MAELQKLELTWIGKDNQPRLEPRILIEDPDKSYGDQNSENMLIHGDNLLALKALEQNFTGKIKCIYIDPPFNTGAAFEHYDDGLENSIWIDMIYQRLKILKNLLTNDGVLFIHLDDNQVDYCKVVLDEIFLRKNFINRISIDARSPSAFSTVNPGVFKASEYLLWYAKNKSLWESRSLRIPAVRDDAYNKFISNRNKDKSNWLFIPLKLAFLEHLNEDRSKLIIDFLKLSFSKFRDVPKKELKELMHDHFSFAGMLSYPLVSNYLHDKLKIKIESEYIKHCYPYFLEKCSRPFKEKEFDSFVYENASAVIRETEISDSGAGADTVDLKYKSIDNPNVIFRLDRGNGLDPVYIVNGKQISFYDKNVKHINGQLTATKLLTNIWSDISWEGIANEGKVKFKKGKKPEKLIQRCLELSTNKGDFVLDSFLGSGTTAAVAHKMRRKWIGIELGYHCQTHCIPRLNQVVNGKDQGGISRAEEWKGGDGYKFYYLAPSLLKKDKHGNWIIDERYNADMLAAAMAKHESFRYCPSEQLYWKQGFSTENDYIFTTTQFITIETLDKIFDEMQPDESLLICCKSFQKKCVDRFPNITIRKIPNMLLGRCEFGKDDYSFNIINMPTDPDALDFIPTGPEIKGKKKKVKTDSKQLKLFK